MLLEKLDRPLIFAHRGASAERPENTLSAFERAVECGADVLELDVRLSRDGEVMIQHDASVQRISGENRLVSDMTRMELQQLALSAQTLHPSKVRVAALDELLNAHPTEHFNIEFKHGGSEIILKTLELLAPLKSNQVILCAAKHNVLMEVESHQHNFGRGMSQRGVQSFIKSYFGFAAPHDWTHRALQIPPKVWGLPLATRKLMAYAHSLDMEVHVWTINSVPEAAQLLNDGADGIMTDDPARVCKASLKRPST